MSGIRVAICGATGLVGETLLRVLEDRKAPVEELRLFASEQSAGRKLGFRDREYEVEALEKGRFEGLDVVFSALDEGLTEKFVPRAQKHCLVIDKSSVYRLKSDVPLVVPEVNPEALERHKNLVATPNCTTIPLVMVLAPLYCEFGVKRVIVASYQSASGGGRDALEEYLYETEFIALRRAVERPADSPFPVQLAGNVIPQVGKFEHDGYTREEHKTMVETRKILGLSDLGISATCVRVPVAVGHALAVSVELDRPASAKQAQEVLARAPGLKVLSGDKYPTPLDSAGRDEVLVGRIRRDLSVENNLHLWIVADNLRKGAALNAVQIAEHVLKWDKLSRGNGK